MDRAEIAYIHLSFVSNIYIAFCVHGCRILMSYMVVDRPNVIVRIHPISKDND